MTVLVTGGAGYVGSHTVRRLREDGRAVVVLDSLELGHCEAVLDAELVVGDVRNSALVARVVRDHDVDAVIHFAAYKAPGDSMVDPGRYFDNNVGATLALLRSLDLAGVRRFVFSSTCAVYGTPETTPVTEDHRLRPESPYGESKRIVEDALGWFERCRGLRSVPLRYFNAAGASLDGRIGEDWSVTTNLIPLAIKAALGQSPELRVCGTDYPTPDGTAIRDYIHVLDLADAHVKALDYLEAGGPSVTLNLGTGQGSSVLEVLAEIERVAGRPVPAVHTERRPGDPVALWADNTRARQTLKWTPHYGLADIVETAWRWHRSQL
ncbi:MAG: UDP-glucose 4-epimerase GalE [Acidimicrobiales bacterium]